jgi:hypothetical protein
MKRATLLIEFTKDKKYNLQYTMRRSTKMQTELGNPIQYYLVLKIVLNVNQLLDKNLEINLWDTNV